MFVINLEDLCKFRSELFIRAQSFHIFINTFHKLVYRNDRQSIGGLKIGQKSKTNYNNGFLFLIGNDQIIPNSEG